MTSSSNQHIDRELSEHKLLLKQTAELSETAVVLGLVDGCLSRQAALSAAVAPRLLGFSVPRALKELSKPAPTEDVAAAVNTGMAAACKLSLGYPPPGVISLLIICCSRLQVDNRVQGFLSSLLQATPAGSRKLATGSYRQLSTQSSLKVLCAR